MLARTWRGATKAEDADRYLDYLHHTGLAEYRKIEGHRGVLALRRVADGQAEFLLVSMWDSESAIRRFAGPDIGRAVFYPEDEHYLIDHDNHVTHYEVVFDSVPVAQS